MFENLVSFWSWNTHLNHLLCLCQWVILSIFALNPDTHLWFFKKSTRVLFPKVNILGQTMTAGFKKLSNIYRKDDVFWFNIEIARNPNSNRNKNRGKNAEGRAGEVPGWHLPCWIPLDPFPSACWSAGVWMAVLSAQSPRKWGREDELFPVQNGAASQSTLLFMVVPWHKVLVCSRQEEMLWDFCFIPNVFFLLDLTVSGKTHLKFVGFFLQKNLQVWKLTWAWAADTHKLQQMGEIKLACEIEFFCISQPGLLISVFSQFQ